MATTFLLTEQPFIPVRYLDGRTGRLGLRDLFTQAHTIADIEAPTPPAGAAMLRVLYAMAYRIASRTDPRLADPETVQNPRAWLKARNSLLESGRFDAASVDAYFAAVADGLDLFDPARPALQDPRLATECTDADGKPSSSGVNKLVVGRSTGVNGAVWFGHDNDLAPEPVDAATAVWQVLVHRYFGPGGRGTARRVGDKKYQATSKAGPLRGTVSFYPLGPDLHTTLLLGIPVFDPDQASLDVDDACPWETDVLPDSLAPAAPLAWPTGLLTGRSRHAVLLVPAPDSHMVEDAYVTWSTHLDADPVLDPYLIWGAGNDGKLRPRLADLGRSVWRDVDALLIDGNQRPRIFAHARWLPQQVRARLRVRAYGFAQSVEQQKDDGWYAATTPPILQYLEEHDPVMALRFAQVRAAAEALGDRLDLAARVAWAEATDTKIERRKPVPWVGPATTAYWSAAEAIFWRQVTADGSGRPHWEFYIAAEQALKAAIGNARKDQRVARAFRRAQTILRSALPAPADPDQG